jgi:DNA-binding MarR family transcriptional regulator
LQRSGRDKGQVARLIDGPRVRGLLDASADEQDRPSLQLTLSPASWQAQAVLQKQGLLLPGYAVKGLSDDERLLLASLLARVRVNLERE